MVAHPLSASARARKELEALKLALAEKDEAALRLLSERYAHRQGPKALQILIRKLASTEEMATFWQLQLLPKEIQPIIVENNYAFPELIISLNLAEISVNACCQVILTYSPLIRFNGLVILSPDI